MLITIALLLEDAAAAAPVPEAFDLRAMPPATGCHSGTGQEIVVCGSRRLPDRLEPLPPVKLDGPLVAEMKLGGGWNARLHASSVELSGAVSQRAMVTFTTHF